MEYNRTAFVLIPYFYEDGFEAFSKKANSSEYLQRSDTSATKYLLNYVAGRINNSEITDSVCQYKNYDFEKLIKDKIVSNDNKYFIENYDAVFNLEAIKVFAFNTDIVLFAVKIRFCESDYVTMSKLLFAIKEKPESISCINSDGKKTSGFYLKNLIKSVAEKTILGNDVCKLKNNNIYSHDDFQRLNIISYYETDDLKDNFEEAVFRLGHCYDDSFVFSDSTSDICSIYTNNAVCQWGITAETVACIAYPDKTEFVQKYFSANFDNCYLLMFALLLNQKFELYELLGRINKKLLSEEDGSYKTAFSFRDDFYRFEQNFNFHIISEVPQYQNVYNIMYKSLGIDRLMDDVKEPLEAINAILHEKEENKERESEQKTESLLTIISALAISSALIDTWDFLTNIKCIWFGEPVPNIYAMKAQLIFSALILLTSLIVLARIILIRKKKKK